MKYLIFAFSLLTLACATRDVTPMGLDVMSDSAYQNIINEYSDATERYSGLYNTITMRSTILNSKVAHAQMDQSARLYLWEKPKYDEENANVDKKNKTETNVFVSFYTPERKHDNLDRSKTLWKVFLDVNGKRYEGKAARIKKLVTSEIQGLYSYHNTFSTAYIVTFPVPMSDVEKSPSKLTVTGPVGSATQSYPALSN